MTNPATRRDACAVALSTLSGAAAAAGLLAPAAAQPADDVAFAPHVNAAYTGGIMLTIDASGGTGSLAISGGNEQDSVALEGTIDTLVVGDAGDITGTGASSDTALTRSGSCAGAP